MRRAPIPGLSAGEHTLASDVAHYLHRVIRLERGDTFVAFDSAARVEADATVLEATSASYRIHVSPLRPASVVASVPLVLVYALAKGDKVDAVVRDATELGATSIVIARTERCVVKADDAKGAAKVDRWKRIAVEAARQCGRGDGPEIHGVHSWTDALDLAATSDVRFVLDPHAASPLGGPLALAAARRASIAFAIGPEGGLTQREIEAACARGFAPSSLGPIVLRTETVGAAILGAVRVLTDF